MVDLDHRAQGIVPVLVLAAPDRQHVVEPEADRALPERQHRIGIVGGKADIDLRLRQFHRMRRLVGFQS
jgi:hypothetical protein